MKVKVVIIAIIWLMPVACWLGVPRGDRGFAAGTGCVFAVLMTVFVARQPMLRCGGCGATTSSFANYTSSVARLRGNRRRYMICAECGETIDRVSGRTIEGEPDTPVVRPSSRSDIGRGFAGFGCLLVFGALAIGSVVLVAISRGVGQTERGAEILFWCGVSAAAGIALMIGGRFLFGR